MSKEDKILAEMTQREIESALPPAPVDTIKKVGHPTGGPRVDGPSDEDKKPQPPRRTATKIPMPTDPADVAKVQSFTRGHMMGALSVLVEIVHTKNAPVGGRLKAVQILLDCAGYTVDGKRAPAVDTIAAMSDKEFKEAFDKAIKNTDHVDGIGLEIKVEH